jgi:Ethanolamine utilization protein EutJ (predicted chaperonin)
MDENNIEYQAVIYRSEIIENKVNPNDLQSYISKKIGTPVRVIGSMGTTGKAINDDPYILVTYNAKEPDGITALKKYLAGTVRQVIDIPEETIIFLIDQGFTDKRKIINVIEWAQARGLSVQMWIAEMEEAVKLLDSRKG